MKIASVPWRCGHSWANRGSARPGVRDVEDRGGVQDLDAGAGAATTSVTTSLVSAGTGEQVT